MHDEELGGMMYDVLVCFHITLFAYYVIKCNLTQGITKE
jgi:hypothetical protein